MCKYAMVKYKSHYACFNCRKGFKRKLLRDVTGNDKFQDKEARCPECGGLMANMGKDFETPPRHQLKAWKHLKDLYIVGITFHSCGCTGPGYIPANKERLVTYLEEQLHEFHQQLNFWRRRVEPGNDREVDRDRSKNWHFIRRVSVKERENRKFITNEEGRKYWISRIDEMEEKLGKIQ